tara:strand:- start:8625 stop:9404 length:780 start_codon:yes stop_codon:yes gene_type:complete
MLKQFSSKFLIAGPCSLESENLSLEVASQLKDISSKFQLPIVFKGSWDKANRTSATSYRGLGLDEGLKVLDKVKKDFDMPVITDVHETYQVQKVCSVVDIVQIPAFLCRQTDLLSECGKYAQVVNVKKGQFMHPEDMKYAIDKVKHGGDAEVLLCERGSSFGYKNLVVDMRSIAIMKQYANVVFDATHSVQLPGGGDGKSAGERHFVEPLAKAALAAGSIGLFLETHPDPDRAMSDGPNMIPLNDLESLIERLLPYWGK